MQAELPSRVGIQKYLLEKLWENNIIIMHLCIVFLGFRGMGEPATQVKMAAESIANILERVLFYNKRIEGHYFKVKLDINTIYHS